MKIAIFSITRDRLAYTKECFASLHANAGHDFAHYIIDNGSHDGTVEWLANEYRPHYLGIFDQNRGISVASNNALEEIFSAERFGLSKRLSKPDLIIKMDNDCLVTTPGLLAKITAIYEGNEEASRYVLSPRVTGIVNQPKRVRHHVLAGHTIGITAIVGGLFHIVPAAIYREFMADGGYDEKLPRGWGQDDQICDWLARKSYAKGYIEDLTVEHYLGTDGQHKDDSAFFHRKWKELDEDKGKR